MSLKTSKRFIPHEVESSDVRDVYQSIIGEYPKKVERYFSVFTREYIANGYDPSVWSLKNIDACFIGSIKVRLTVSSIGVVATDMVFSLSRHMALRNFSSVINTYGEVLSAKPNGSIPPVGIQFDTFGPATRVSIDSTKVGAEYGFRLFVEWNGYLCYGQNDFNESVTSTIPVYPYRQPL